MTPSENCLALIRNHEGLRVKAYRCPAGVWTIGYGHTYAVMPGSRITAEEAEELLQRDADVAALSVPRTGLNQNQYDALVSFVFNLGGEVFKKSTLRRLVIDGLYKQAAAEFPRWVYAKGQVLSGLVVRRADERALFERPV